MKNKIQKKLFLDDVRQNPFIGNWVVAKNYEEAIAALEKYEITEAWLDHDLSLLQTIGDADASEKTGYDVVKWMKENNKFPTEVCMVHSANPWGSERMCRMIAEHYGTFWKDHYYSALRFVR